MRLIDADELIYLEYEGLSFVPKDFVDDAQTIEGYKASKWIPVSERLPEVRYVGKYANGYTWWSEPMLVTTYDGSRTVAYHQRDNHGCHWLSEEECFKPEYVIAWMPVPEAYKEEGD